MARHYLNKIPKNIVSLFNNGKSLFMIITILLLIIIVQIKTDCGDVKMLSVNGLFPANIKDENQASSIGLLLPEFDNTLTVENSVINQSCRRNTGILVQRMRDTQRQINRYFQENVPNITRRSELFPYVFGPAMDGFRYVLQPFKFYSRDEFKYFVGLSDPKSPCNHITLGVGGSWDGEKALRKKYPQCRLLGVDTTAGSNRMIVESIPNSRFLHRKVGNITGKPAKPGDPRPTRLTDLLMTENEGRVVDFLSMDIEGAEYVVLDVLHKQRMQLPVICQFNVEIHYGKSHYGVSWEHLDHTLNEMLEEAHFVLLNINERTIRYKRMHFLNIADEECITKFLC